MGIKDKTENADAAEREHSVTWSLSDSGMDLLERTGLAGLYMALRAAKNVGADLSPLIWSDDDLKSDSVTVRWKGPARPAFARLLAWAWQVQEGVLYFPAIHGDRERLSIRDRVSSHTGIMRTFLQHVNSQPKLDSVTRVVQIDDHRTITVTFESPAQRVDDHDREINPKTKRLNKKKIPTDRLRPHEDLEKLFDKSGEFIASDASLSNWLYPGIAGRFGAEKSWVGTPQAAILLMLAPTVCLFLRLQGEGGNWVFVVPDVRDLAEFDATRPRMVLNADFTDVASLGDAAMEFLAEYSTRHPRQQMAVGCRVVAMGYVGYYQGQSIRKSVLDVSANRLQVKRYRIVHTQLPNQYIPIPIKEVNPENVSIRGTKRGGKKLATENPSSNSSSVPKPNGFFKLPSARGRIADNLVSGRAWYSDLTIPTSWEQDELERTRKRNGQLNQRDGGNRPTSHDTILFQGLTYQRSKLMKLIAEDDMWDTEAEKIFVEAFWEALSALLAQEGKATERGGSRTAHERFEDLTEDLRRKLTQAKTRTLLRSTLADIFAKAGRRGQKALREHPAAIWRLIDDPLLWRKGRDLALLALVSRPTKKERETESSTQAGT